MNHNYPCVLKVLYTPEILMDIFCYLDSAEELRRTCSLVCRLWSDVLSTRYFWLKYFEKRLFGKNLMDNPSGEKDFKGWTITQNGGKGFIIEKPPYGNGIESEWNVTSAFVTSYYLSVKHCLVDLNVFGGTFLDKVRPPIVVSECYACRSDCSSTYFLKVQLLTWKEAKVIVELGPSGHTNYLPEEEITSEKCIVRIRHLDCSIDTRWNIVEHTFKNYPEGIRFVFFEHGGVDKRFWAGSYGSKMARASVVVYKP